MSTQLTVQAKANVLSKQDTQAFITAFKKSDEMGKRKAFGDLGMKIAVKTHPHLTYNETKKALESVKLGSSLGGYCAVEGDKVVSGVPTVVTLIVPSKIGLPLQSKVAGFEMLVGDAFLGFATFIGAVSAYAHRSEFKYTAPGFMQYFGLNENVSAIISTIYSYAIPISLAIAGGYGVFRIAKNIITEWKAARVCDLQMLACAVETAVGAVLPKQN